MASVSLRLGLHVRSRLVGGIIIKIKVRNQPRTTKEEQVNDFKRVGTTVLAKTLLLFA